MHEIVAGNQTELPHRNLSALQQASSNFVVASGELERQLEEMITELATLKPETQQSFRDRLASIEGQRRQIEQLFQQRLEAQQHQEQAFTLLAEQIPDIIARFDRSLRHIYINRAIELASGIPAPTFIGKTNRELGMPETLCQEWEQALQSVFSTGQPQTIEFNFLTPQGTKFYQSWIVPELAEDKVVRSVLSITRDFTALKSAESQLRDSEERYRLLFESNPHPMWVYDVETLAFLAVNEAAIAHYGYSRTEFLEMILLDLYGEEDRPTLPNRRQELFTPDRPGVSEQRHRKKDGTAIDVETSSYALTLVGREARAVLVTDITECKRIQEGLRQSEERFRIALKNSPIVVFNQDRQLRYTWIYNPSWRDSEHLMLGKTDADFISTLDADRLTAIKRRVLETGVGIRTEISVTLQGETKFYDLTIEPLYNDRGVLLGITGASMDISDRKRVEIELQQFNETLEAQVAQRTTELETLFDTLPDYICVVERERMRISFANNRFAQMTRFTTRHQVQGKTLVECLPPEKAESLSQQHQQVFTVGEPLHFQESIEATTGTLHLDTFKIPLKRKTGEVYALISTSRDVTELVKTKQILWNRTRQLEVTNKELESFSYSVSHDLRTPLRHILGFTDALQQRLRHSNALNDPKTVHYLDVIRNSSQKMEQLIDGLLTLSRLGRQQISPKSLDLKQLVAATIDWVKPQIASEEGNRVEFEVGNLPMVIADETLLRQVFVNLIGNAVKFSSGGKKVAQSMDRLAKITIGSLTDGTIFVRDNGVGFDMKYADRLFGAFQRLHSQSEFEGMGIGLAIVERIIQRHNGSIWVNSQPDRGATFYFKLGPIVETSDDMNRVIE